MYTTYLTSDKSWYLASDAKHSRNVSNLLAMAQLATVEEWQDGINWYPRAHAAALQLAERYSCSVEVASAVIAVLSPGCPWPTNLRDAETTLMSVTAGLTPDDYKVSTYGQNKLKAFKIALTGDVSLVSGEKVSSFYRNILDPDSNDVTVDRHAIKVWLGMTDGGSIRFTKAVYESAARDYREAAEIVGVAPAAFQAICWVVYKRIVDR